MPQGRVYKHTLCLQANLAQSISQFPNVPKDTSPDGPTRFGKLRNWEMAGGTDFPISQFPKRPQPIWLSTIWEVGRWLQVHTSQFPNFPKKTSPSGSARFGKLGNGYRYILPNFQISQKTPAQMGQHDLGNWEIGKLGNGLRYRFPNFPKDLSPSGSARFGKLGNWEICRGMYFPISQFPK